MLARWIGTGFIATLLATATVASAQIVVPDLKGSWSGTAEIVHRSEVAEHVACQTVLFNPPVHDRD
jgi:hypothetical protein